MTYTQLLNSDRLRCWIDDRARLVEEGKRLYNEGEFDWEKLPAAVQNEYDDLCALLDRLQDTGERLALRDLLQQEGEEMA